MWKNVDEYRKWNFPVAIEFPERLFRDYMRQTPLQRIANLAQYLLNLEATAERFNHVWLANPEAEAHTGSEAYMLSVELAEAGEELLMYCEAIARTEIAADFRGHKELFKHWQRYGTKRLPFEVPHLLSAARLLARAVRSHIEQSGCALEPWVTDLPSLLRKHFDTARDLLSVDLREMAGFAALRGLEATLRELVRKGHITFQPRKTTDAESLCDADLYDLIEAGKRLRWASDKKPILSAQAASLLHYLRTVRNVTAHASEPDEDSWDEIVQTATKYAASLWRTSRSARRRIVPRLLERTW